MYLGTFLSFLFLPGKTQKTPQCFRKRGFNIISKLFISALLLPAFCFRLF
jgi:hypothetical protein